MNAYRMCGGDSWTRTNDPIDVNDVLYYDNVDHDFAVVRPAFWLNLESDIF